MDDIAVDPVTHEVIRRSGGWTMFFWSALIAGLAIALVLLGVERTFPTHLDPVVWRAVDIAGNSLTQ